MTGYREYIVGANRHFHSAEVVAEAAESARC
jgi:hypothetical protein